MSVLTAIVQQKRRDIAALKAAARADLPDPRPSRRSLEAALRAPGARFICECKRASPSEGVIRPNYNPAGIAADYDHVADAISVLTDTPYFGGRMEHLSAVRAVTDIPVLCKDFFIDTFQVRHARRAGADAILLMLSVLDDDTYRALAAEAERFSMDILTEVRDEPEADRAIALGARIVGVNNRNLDTLSVDRAVTTRMASYIRTKHIEAHPTRSTPVVLCESGISAPEHVAEVMDDVDGFLVGTHLMRADDLVAEARALRHGRWKACGLTTPGDARAAYDAGATFGGLMFVPASKRAITEDDARAIVDAAPLQWAGVFADAAPEDVARVAKSLGLAVVQLHGEETPADVAATRNALAAQELTHVELWKALPATGTLPTVDDWNADRIVLDAPRAGLTTATPSPASAARVKAATASNAVPPIAPGTGKPTAAAATATAAPASASTAGTSTAGGAKTAAAESTPSNSTLPATGPAFGGSGNSFDWSILADCPPHLKERLIVAGGVGLHNAARGRRLGVYALDASTHLEWHTDDGRRPEGAGRKDPARLRAFGDVLAGIPTSPDDDTHTFTPPATLTSELLTDLPTTPALYPDAQRPGYFGDFGGMFVPEILVPALDHLASTFENAWASRTFRREYATLLEQYAGRPTPLYECRRFRAEGGARLFLKREDLVHGGAHKTNQVLGQALLAKHMGKTELIAETGAGQHGVATAMVGALFGLPTRIFMGAKDIERQTPNVRRMRMMGAEVIPVQHGNGTLKDAVGEAMREWSATYNTTHYVLGTAAGPHPYPSMVREFQRIIGAEARSQMLYATGSLPDAVVACVGGGSNAIGMFTDFLHDDVRLIGVEPAGHGISTGLHGATIAAGAPGILHGCRTLVLTEQGGQIRESHSVSAGLDYPAVGPQHAHLAASGAVEYAGVTDDDAIAAVTHLARTEGIIPALESAHALAHGRDLAASLPPTHTVVVNLSGRGDKDLDHVADYTPTTINLVGTP